MFTAVLLHPALHELGHSLATLVFGGKVIEFHLLPLPNMLCDGSSVGNAGLVTIAVSGVALQQCDLAERNIRISQPAHLLGCNLAGLDDFQLCGNVVRIVCHCLVLLFDIKIFRHIWHSRHLLPPACLPICSRNAETPKTVSRCIVSG